MIIKKKILISNLNKLLFYYRGKNGYKNVSCNKNDKKTQNYSTVCDH